MFALDDSRAKPSGRRGRCRRRRGCRGRKRAPPPRTISHGNIAVRPGAIFARVSLARSLVPITNAARRVSTSLAAAAMSRALSMASGVSIIAHTRIFWSALMSTRRSATSSRWSALDTFGTSTASGLALATALRSSSHHCVSRPLMRTITSRAPKAPALTASETWRRAAAFASGATESSRSRMTASVGKVRAFSMARALEPGMYNTLRRGRMLMSMWPSDRF